MANAEKIIRVSESEADWLNMLRDRYGFGSVAVVVARLRSAFGAEFEQRLERDFPSGREES